ncbi:MAG: cystathionine gamma-lyase [Solirubrobacteraceae bacterium]|nr:cystathionine gamma-lyase [Solirubrobacteraceae bacterium]
MSEPHGPSTRSVHAGLPPAAQGEPFLPGPVLASAYHLAGDDVHATHGYLREGNPTWEAYERALGGLEGGDVVIFSSGMAAATAVMLSLEPGAVLVAPVDGYFGVRALAEGHIADRGVEVRLVPNEQGAIERAAPGASMIIAESPSNPGLEVIDVGALRALAPDAALVIDNTVATPLGFRPLDHGATMTMASATKALSGHSDLLMGYVATRDRSWFDRLKSWRTLTGAIPGPLETWLAHRSLATLGIRVERQLANAAALAGLLRARDDVDDVRWPGVGAVVCFTLPDAAAVARFFAAGELIIEATSFGGVHTSGERRARWGTDDIAEGFDRFSVGIEDTADVRAAVTKALDAAAS